MFIFGIIVGLFLGNITAIVIMSLMFSVSSSNQNSKRDNDYMLELSNEISLNNKEDGK